MQPGRAHNLDRSISTDRAREHDGLSRNGVQPDRAEESDQARLKATSYPRSHTDGCGWHVGKSWYSEGRAAGTDAWSADPWERVSYSEGRAADIDVCQADPWRHGIPPSQTNKAREQAVPPSVVTYDFAVRQRCSAAAAHQLRSVAPEERPRGHIVAAQTLEPVHEPNILRERRPAIEQHSVAGFDVHGGKRHDFGFERSAVERQGVAGPDAGFDVACDFGLYGHGPQVRKDDATACSDLVVDLGVGRPLDEVASGSGTPGFWSSLRLRGLDALVDILVGLRADSLGFLVDALASVRNDKHGFGIRTSSYCHAMGWTKGPETEARANDTGDTPLRKKVQRGSRDISASLYAHLVLLVTMLLRAFGSRRSIVDWDVARPCSPVSRSHMKGRLFLIRVKDRTSTVHVPLFSAATREARADGDAQQLDLGGASTVAPARDDGYGLRVVAGTTLLPV